MIEALRAASKRFKAAEATADFARMEASSETAWNALTSIFEALRNEENQGRLTKTYMAQLTGVIADGVTVAEQQAMIASKRVDRSHPSLKHMGLRDALNKVAHHDTSYTTYRKDRRGAHYLVLGGTWGKRKWVAEILVSKLVKNAAVVAKAIR